MALAIRFNEMIRTSEASVMRSFVRSNLSNWLSEWWFN